MEIESKWLIEIALPLIPDSDKADIRYVRYSCRLMRRGLIPLIGGVVYFHILVKSDIF